MPEFQPSYEQIQAFIRDEAWDAVATAFRTRHPADIAALIDRAPDDLRDNLFALLPPEVKPDVLAELESVAGADVIESLSNTELSEIVEEMAPDDAADVLADLTEDRSESVLALMEKKDSDDVRRLMEYDEDTAGGIMTTDVVAMKENQTVEEAIQAIAYFDTSEPLYYAYIVGSTGSLVGYANIWELLRERQRLRPLCELVHHDCAFARVDDDQEEVAQMMSRYNLSSIPVVDNDRQLVGRVTVDDVFDVIEEEASEDIFRLAGSDDAELESPSALRSCMVRLPWLLITLCGGFITSMILSRFHAHISQVITLAAFVPIVLAMGGNTGIQASTLVVRSIALGDMKGRSVAKILSREILIGAIMGSVCGIIIGIWASFFIVHAPQPSAISALHVGAIVALALFAAMAFAAVFGAAVPIVLHRSRIDPAVASGPFVTITNDILALLIYFGVTILLLHGAG